MTNLSGGLLRGLQEARRVAGAAGATLLLLSDGHANAGETDPDRLAGSPRGARAHGVTTSTVGIGLGYDETLLAAIARGGQGNHVFAGDGDGAGAAVAGEVEGLLSKTVQAASLIVRPDGAGRDGDDLERPAVAAGRERRDGRARRPLGGRGAQARAVLRRAREAGARPGARSPSLELRYVALPGVRRGDDHDAAARQRRPGRPGRGPDARPEGPHRARVPAGAGRQAPRGRGAQRAATTGGAIARLRAPREPRWRPRPRPRRSCARRPRSSPSWRTATASGDGAWAAKRSRAEHALQGAQAGPRGVTRGGGAAPRPYTSSTRLAQTQLSRPAPPAQRRAARRSCSALEAWWALGVDPPRPFQVASVIW